ncbi:MAG: NusG domain II-containing protein [Clostridia bacterium]|nr:NusG domain II-containing protein [Clostridia bacterium]MBQ2274183.1 NusG domain II-containing protein [Clostridia bacterium]
MSIKKALLNHKNDILLATGILLLAAICFLIFSFSMKEGKYALVTVDGEQVYKHSLNEDDETVILGANSSSGEQNVLVIKDGKAFVKSANCPDKICVSHRKISKTGETIVCLPHKVVVSVVEE